MCLCPRKLCREYVDHICFSFVVGEGDQVQVFFCQLFIFFGCLHLLFRFLQLGQCGSQFLVDLVYYVALLQLLYTRVGFLLPVGLEPGSPA